MGIRFSADEVFQMAIHTEKCGAAFYRRAAELKADEGDCAFLTKLAEMEDGHETTFTRMREELTAREKEPTAFDPYDEAAMYLDALTDAQKGEGEG